jgi:Cu+-exporting ATPase
MPHQPLTDPRRPQQKVTIKVAGMHCTNCALSLEKHLLKVGANTPSVDYATGHTSFLIPTLSALPEIVKSIERLGYTVKSGGNLSNIDGIDNADRHGSKHAHDHAHDHHHHDHNLALYIKAAIAAVLTAPLLIAMFLPHSVLHHPWLQCLLATPVFIIGVLHFGGSGWRSIRAGVANMDVLICLGIVAGYLSSIISLLANLSREMIFFEATSSIVTFVMIGHLLEDRAVRKTTSAIESLAALQPLRAVRLTSDSRIEEIQAAEVGVNDLLQVNSGDIIPTDGIVERGEISCNETMITGESLPVDRKTGDRVIGGSIAVEGRAVIRASAVGDDTVLASIVRLVHEAHQRKPNIQRLGDAVSAVFVPGVIAISIIVLLGGMLFFQLSPTQALVRALAIAVVACPCAMGLATPTAIMVALGRAATSGILIRGGDTLERLATIKQVSFDKTGTLTAGQLRVTDLETYNDTPLEEARRIIASLQRGSSHPIAKALVAEFAASPSHLNFNSITETKGVGLEGVCANGDTYNCGGRAVKERFNLDHRADIVLLKNGALIASLNLNDTIRPEAKNVLNQLNNLGLTSSIISGDTNLKTRRVADEIGITEAYGEQLPDQKLALIREKQTHTPLAYVGDGINDAPTLAEASVGVSLSSASDVAMHSAQVILTGNTLKNLPAAIRLARVTVRTIKQNLFWAFFYNIITISLAAFGYISPLAGALIMTGSDIIIVANSLRIKFARLG